MSWQKQPILVFDTETTGLDSHVNRIIEIAWTSYAHGEIHGEGSFLLDPQCDIPEFITTLTGITQADTIGQPTFGQFAPHLDELLLLHPIVCGYNAIGFDKHFLIAELIRCGATHTIQALLQRPWIDPLIWVRHFQKYEKGKKLVQAAERLGINVGTQHRALSDAKTCMEIMHHYLPKMPRDLGRALELQQEWAQESDANYGEWRSKREEIGVEDENGV